MSNRSVHVVRPGLHTTVQDLGRWGFQALGVPVAGAMDPFSHRFANALLGNPRNAATLEITLIGPDLEFEGDCFAAVAGAEFGVTIDGAAVPHAHPFKVSSKSTMRFGARSHGARAYLAVDGGFDVPLVLASRSTHVPSGIGGWEGRSLRKGDRIPIAPAERSSLTFAHPTTHALDTVIHAPVVRVLSGPDRHRFVDDALDALQGATYTIAPDSDRMGFRLHGPGLQHSHGADMISDVTPVGTVQVPGSGQPILLMADRQTAGGYPRIATMISADLGIAGQLAPGDALAFRICTPADALSALIAQENALLALEARP